MTTAHSTRAFGLWTLTFLVIGNMIGAGVFTTSGFTLQSLGSQRLVILAWVVAGLIAIAGAASYGQLIRAMPESGGEYLFLSRAAHPMLGFIAGWVSLIAGFTGAIAFAATALESYVAPAATRPAWLPDDSIAILAIAVAGLFHGLRPRVGAALQNAVVLLKLILLAAFLLVAIVNLGTSGWHVEPTTPAASTGTIAVAFAASLVWISLSYSGFNAAVYVAEEVQDVRQVVPKALVLGTVIVTVLYVSLNAIFVYGAPSGVISGVPDVAAVAAESLGGRYLGIFIRVVISAALFTSVLAMMMAAPRVYAKMAVDGLMPAALKLRGDVPQAAVFSQAMLATVFVSISSLQGLLTYLGLTLSLTAACSAACLFSPRVRSGPILHPKHILPVFYIVGTVIAATMMTINQPKQLLGTTLTFCVGAVTYLIVRRTSGRPTDALSVSESQETGNEL